MSAYPPLPPPPPGGEPQPVADDPAEGSGRSAAKIVLALAAVLAVVTGVVLGGRAWIGTRDPCRGSTVTSARFGYCLEAPGWDFTNDRISVTLPYDELVHGADGSSIRIQAAAVGERTLADVISDVRKAEGAQDDIALGEVRDTIVAGVPAGQWDVTSEQEGDPFQAREVAFAQDGTAWLVRLIADPSSFETSVGELERILSSWIFR
jgi:hypothetical protein